MIGKTISEKRRAAGYTQAQLAERLGVTAPAVNRWEKDLSYPDATLLAPLARLLKIDMNELFSFYDTLSDSERKLTVKRFGRMLFEGNENEAFAYIDGVLKENPSDGSLFKDVADVLYSFHMIKRVSDETAFLDRIILYYERAIELNPEFTLEISHGLLSIYGYIGNREKAEEALARIPDMKIDKKWAYAELLYSLKQYDEALPEIERRILSIIVDLYVKLNLLQDTLDKAGRQELAHLAREKNEALIKLFEVWNGLDALSIITSSNVKKDADGMIQGIEQLLTSQSLDRQISSCPLFAEASFGGKGKADSTLADQISDLINMINERDKPAGQ